MDGESYGRSFVISIHAPHAGSDSQTKNTESMRDSTYNFANLIKQVLWSTQNRY